jgi:hypothetical protein
VAMLLPVRCKLLRKRPNQSRLATSAAWLAPATTLGGAFRLNKLNMRTGFYNALCVHQRTVNSRSFYETPM